MVTEGIAGARTRVCERNGLAAQGAAEDGIARVRGTRGVDDDKGLITDLRTQLRVDVEAVFDPPWSHGVGGAKGSAIGAMTACTATKNQAMERARIRHDRLDGASLG